MYSRREPYEGEDMEEVLRLVIDKSVHKRPPVPKNMPQQIRSIMSDCVEADPNKRPTLSELGTRLKRIDDDDFSDPDEETDPRTSLYDTFPRHTADALIAGEVVEAEYKDCVTIVFSGKKMFLTW